MKNIRKYIGLFLVMVLSFMLLGTTVNALPAAMVQKTEMGNNQFIGHWINVEHNRDVTNYFDNENPIIESGDYIEYCYFFENKSNKTLYNYIIGLDLNDVKEFCLMDVLISESDIEINWGVNDETRFVYIMMDEIPPHTRIDFSLTFIASPDINEVSKNYSLRMRLRELGENWDLDPESTFYVGVYEKYKEYFGMSVQSVMEDPIEMEGFVPGTDELPMSPADDDEYVELPTDAEPIQQETEPAVTDATVPETETPAIAETKPHVNTESSKETEMNHIMMETDPVEDTKATEQEVIETETTTEQEEKEEIVIPAYAVIILTFLASLIVVCAVLSIKMRMAEKKR